MLDSACSAGRVDVVKCLVDIIMEPANNYADAIFDYDLFAVALAAGNREICAILLPYVLANGADISQAIFDAARSGSREMCEYASSILNGHINIDAMLHGAVAADSPEMCDLAREWFEIAAARDGVASDNSDEGWRLAVSEVFTRAAETGAAKVFAHFVEWGERDFAAALAVAVRSNEYRMIRLIREHAAACGVQVDVRDVIASMDVVAMNAVTRAFITDWKIDADAR
jgi:hypothetical protein